MGSKYMFLLIALYFVTLATAGMGDECDWTGSGLTSVSPREVTPVYLRCRAGKISWLYPRGALRVILRLHNSEREFKVCIRILSSSDENPKYDQEPDLYSEDRVLDFREEFSRRKSRGYKPRGTKRGRDDYVDNDVYEESDFDNYDVDDSEVDYTSEKLEEYMLKMRNKTRKGEFPARLFLEGSRGLLPLYAADDGHGKEVRCFRSKGGQAAVYVEAVPSPGGALMPRRAARLQYDLQPLPSSSYDPGAEECRPCSDQEMAHAFCTSDLVTRGIIVDMQQRKDLDTSELTIKVTKLIRYSSPGGRTYQAEPEAGLNSSSRMSWMAALFEDDVDTGMERGKKRRKVRKETWYAKVQVGAHCGVAPGPGEFLVAARRKLGALSLACAPRLEDWTRVAKELNDNESAHCILTT